MTASNPSGLTLERLTTLDPATAALVRFAVAIALGRESGLEPAARALPEAGVPASWADELLLQSVLMVGWPRALEAAAVWRRVAGPHAGPGSEAGTGPPGAVGKEAANDGVLRAWRERGEAICRLIYGANYERLRANVRALHPALDAWMVTDGYGRTLGRPGLDLARRELCTVAQVAVQGAERQLHSHLRGALHAGASLGVLEQVVRLVAPELGVRERETVNTLWDRVRASEERRT